MSKILTFLRFLVIVLLSPLCSIFIWCFFFQFYNVVDFKVSLKALVLNMLSKVKVHSKDDDFLLLIGLDCTQFDCFDWFFSALLIVEMSKSVLIIGFFLVSALWLSWEFFLIKFSMLLKGTRLFIYMIGRFLYSKLLLF